LTDELHAAVDDYLDDLFGFPDTALLDALTRSDEAGLPPISISSNLGRFLQVMVAARGARRVLEIGTLGGYSTIWLARALPDDGRLVTLEFDPKHAQVARTNLDEAGVGDRVDILVGRASDSLVQMQADGVEPFDLAFIDADKETYVEYLDAVVALARPGTVIIADNVIRRGEILDPDSDDTFVQGVRRFNAALAAHPALQATSILQLVGHKGHDGVAIAVVADPSRGR
jgi:caffeoyl-CoA O-methyltransferase